MIRLIDEYNYDFFRHADAYIDEADYIETPNGRISNGDILGSSVVIMCYGHPESSSYWILCRHNNGQYYEKDIEDGIKIGEYKYTSDLSGGSQW